MHACSWYWGSEALRCRRLRLESQSSAGLRIQAYSRALDLVWLGHLHGTGCLSARTMDTGLPTALWRLCLGPGCAWALDSVTLLTLAGVLGVCVWARVVVSPLHFRQGFVTYAVGLGSWLGPHHCRLGFWGVLGCVRDRPVLAAPGSVVRCAYVCLGSGFGCAPRLLAEGVGCVCVCVHVLPGSCPAWLGVRCGGVCLGFGCSRAPPLLARVLGRVCVGVCASRLYPATPGSGVRCGRLCLGSGFGCAPQLLVGALGCVCVLACAPFLLCHSWWGGVCVCAFELRLLVLGRVASCVPRVSFPSPPGGPPVA